MGARDLESRLARHLWLPLAPVALESHSMRNSLRDVWERGRGVRAHYPFNNPFNRSRYVVSRSGSSGATFEAS